MRFTSRILTPLVWFLDYDGSLCPHLEAWEERQYDSGEILKCLEILKKSSKDVLWNTGRRPESLFGVNESFAKYSGYFIHGSLEYLADQKRTHRMGPPLPSELVDLYSTFTQMHSEFRLEVKETSLRLAAHRKEDVKKLFELIAENPLGEYEMDWQWTRGHRGLELLARGFDKSYPIKIYMQSHLGSIPVVVGDDLLDAPAARYALSQGGFAFLIGDHCGWITQIPHRADQIKYFESPAMFLDWIKTLQDSNEG